MHVPDAEGVRLLARVEVRLRKGVTDPEGENVLKALRLLGFSSVREVSSAKRFLIELDEPDAVRARTAVDEMCRRLLANPVIHEYSIDIVTAKPTKSARSSRGRKAR